MNLNKPAYRKMPLIRFCLSLAVLLAWPLTSQALSISCAFTPQLHCTDQAQVNWSDDRFMDPSLFTINANRLFISQSNRSFSFDLRTGKLLWSHKTNNESRYFYPLYDATDQAIYLARADGMLEKRHAQSGTLIWSRQFGKGWVYPPAIIQDKVITGGQDRMIWVLDAQSGDIVDKITLDQELVTPLLVADDYFIASTFDGQILAYRFGTNKPAWNIHLNAPAFALAASKGIVIASDMDGGIHAIDLDQREIRWQQSLYQNALFWNLIHDQKLYSLNHIGTLNILDTQSGQLQGQHHLAQPFAQPPIIQDDSLALFDAHGAVQRYSLDAINLRLYNL